MGNQFCNVVTQFGCDRKPDVPADFVMVSGVVKL